MNRLSFLPSREYSLPQCWDPLLTSSPSVSPKTLSTAFEHCLGLSGPSQHSMPQRHHSPAIPVRESSQRSNRAPEIKDNNSDSADVDKTDVDGVASDNKQGPSDDEREAQAKSLSGNILLVEDNQVNLKV